MGSYSGNDLHFISPQLDNGQSCKSTDTGPVHPMVCQLTPQLSLVLIN